MRQKPFLDGGVTHGEVYGMATWLSSRLAHTEQRETICLATENRALIAAAILLLSGWRSYRLAAVQFFCAGAVQA